MNLKRWLKDSVAQPIDVARILWGLAASLLLGVVLATLLITGKADDRTFTALDRTIADLETQVDDQQEVTACRSKLAAAVSSAQVDHQLAVGRLVVALGHRDQDAFTANLEALATSVDELEVARDARNRFEDTGDCP